MPGDGGHRPAHPLEQLPVVGEVGPRLLRGGERLPVAGEIEHLRRLGDKEPGPVGGREDKPLFDHLDRVLRHHPQHRGTSLFCRRHRLPDILRPDQRPGAVVDGNPIAEGIEVPERVLDRLLPRLPAGRHNPHLREMADEAVHRIPVFPAADHQNLLRLPFPEERLDASHQHRHAPQLEELFVDPAHPAGRTGREDNR